MVRNILYRYSIIGFLASNIYNYHIYIYFDHSLCDYLDCIVSVVRSDLISHQELLIVRSIYLFLRCYICSYIFFKNI